MRVYLAFATIGLMLATGVLSLIIIIMAFFGKLIYMINAMQVFFFFGKYLLKKKTVCHGSFPHKLLLLSTCFALFYLYKRKRLEKEIQKHLWFSKNRTTRL